jgi:hypothetical protein
VRLNAFSGQIGVLFDRQGTIPQRMSGFSRFFIAVGAFKLRLTMQFVEFNPNSLRYGLEFAATVPFLGAVATRPATENREYDIAALLIEIELWPNLVFEHLN